MRDPFTEVAHINLIMEMIFFYYLLILIQHPPKYYFQQLESEQILWQKLDRLKEIHRKQWERRKHL